LRDIKAVAISETNFFMGFEYAEFVRRTLRRKNPMQSCTGLEIIRKLGNAGFVRSRDIVI
jgi:hypothetical protein